MDKGNGSAGSRIRLLLAVVLVGFCFFGMHPSIFEENICKSITTAELYPRGKILIANLTPYLVTVNFSGTSTFSVLIRPEYSMEEVVKEGSYAWIAYFNYSEYRPIRGFVNVAENKTSGVTIQTGRKR